MVLEPLFSKRMVLGLFIFKTLFFGPLFFKKSGPGAISFLKPWYSGHLCLKVIGPWTIKLKRTPVRELFAYEI